MSGLTLAIIFGVIGAVIAVISVTVAKRQLGEMNAAWQSAAETLGFSFQTGSMRNGPTIAGTVADHPASVYTYTKSSGKSSTRYTRYTVGFPAIGVGLHLSRQAGIGRFLTVLGAQDIVIGSPVFDEAFIVKATDPRAVRVVLTPGRTMALNQLLALHPDVVVLDDRIVIDRHGNVREAEVIVSTLRRVASVANVLADAGASTELTSLIERRLEGTPPSDYEPGSDLPNGIDARISNGEALAAVGIFDVAQKIFEALAVELPADRDIAGWSEQTGRRTRRSGPPVARTPSPPQQDSPMIRPAQTGETEPAPVDEPEQLADTSIDRDAVAVATGLFGENRLSFETSALFDERYAGRNVLWSGKLRKATTVDHYRILGDGPFTKAVVDVAVLENDLFGNTVVTAVVALPPGSIESIPIGEAIAFSGKLVGIDALVRNVFVGGARLE
jgi:hypothetical protein